MSILDRLRDKHLDKWLGGWMRDRLRPRPATHDGTRHLLFAFCDHYEPLWKGAGEAQGRARVAAWSEQYPRLAAPYRDADGRAPRHSFFFPGEQYAPYYLDALAGLAQRGFGEVELHLHHDGDTNAKLRADILDYLGKYAQHGHLSRDTDGRLRYGFIHGNWCLANARRDGRWCGVDDELPLLWDTGCYADFTFPAAPDESQPDLVNAIYWPVGNLAARRAYEVGERARVGERHRDRILMIEGPLTLARRGFGVKIENGDVHGADAPTAARVKSWVDQHVHVSGRPEWTFVKIHTHGAPEKNARVVLGDGFRALHDALAAYNDGARWKLHYVSAREMFNVATAAMDGKSGDPNAYRDYQLAPPPIAK
ncbi:MAG TPA: hypothetical protein VIA18_26015 [Polyangia bacterium]|nr:hypothetical protein [Polyangia bacterium]